ncbi:MAG: hypothetical protein HS115_14320 [Spirochaetales bacterium]|nr:hypothetical protein [Spirochaetales bacterium]
MECKTGEGRLSKHIQYFRDRTPIPQFYQVHLGEKDYRDGNARVLPFETFWKVAGIP